MGIPSPKQGTQIPKHPLIPSIPYPRASPVPEQLLILIIP